MLFQALQKPEAVETSIVRIGAKEAGAKAVTFAHDGPFPDDVVVVVAVVAVVVVVVVVDVVVVAAVVAVVCDWVVVVLTPSPGELDVVHALWALLDQHGGEDLARPGASAADTTPATTSAAAAGGIAAQCIPPEIGCGGRIFRHSTEGYDLCVF